MIYGSVGPGFSAEAFVRCSMEQGLQRVEAIVAPEIDPEGRQKLAGDINRHAPERILPLIQEFCAGLTGS